MTDDRSPTAPERVLYTAVATAEGGRDGRARSDDGVLDLRLAPPAEMGGSDESATNPEQLFAAGYAGCFGSALAAVARRRRVDPGQVTITARVGIGPVAGGAFGLTVELLAHLPNVDRAAAEELVKEAHTVCPYSNATRGNIPVTLRVVDQDDPASVTG